jgi:hypothetical protein
VVMLHGEVLVDIGHDGVAQGPHCRGNHTVA